VAVNGSGGGFAGARSGSVRLFGRWNELVSALDPVKFEARLNRELLAANRRIGRDFQKTARKMIRQGKYVENSPITVILKGSSKPLVRDGDLFQSITYQVVSPKLVRVGVLKQKVGADAVNIARILHEGAILNATPKAKTKVWSMVAEALGRAGKLSGRSRKSVLRSAAALGGGRPTAAWVIPARPFLLAPLRDKRFQRAVFNHWKHAARRAFFGR